MDRDGRGKPPSNEAGSFDLSKMSEAEAAAELALRMARWRDARRHPGKETRDAPARTSVDPAPAAQAPAAFGANAPRELDPATAARIDSALRHATPPRLPRPEGAPVAHVRSFGTAFESVLAEGPNTQAIGMGTERPERTPLRACEPQAHWTAGRPAAKPALAMRAEQAARLFRVLAEKVQTETRAAGRAVRAALESRMQEALRRARAVQSEARSGGTAAWRALTSLLAVRIEGASLLARRIGLAARTIEVTAWREAGPELERLVARLPSFRALGAAARLAAADRLVIASAAVVVIAIAGWVLMPPDAPAPNAARAPQVEKPPARTDARAIAASSTALAPPLPPRPPERRPPDPNPAPVPAMLKPLAQAPALAARLKPGTPQPAISDNAPRAEKPAEAME